MALVARVLGGAGHILTGVTGRVGETGAVLLGEKASKIFGTSIGNIHKGIDTMVGNVVKNEAAYKTAVKEARRGVSKTAAKDAIERSTKEAAEEVTEVTTKVAQNIDDAMSEAVNNARSLDTFTLNGSLYTKQGERYFIKKNGADKFVETTSKNYGHSKSGYVRSQEEAAKQSFLNNRTKNLQLAEETAKTGATDHAGVDLDDINFWTLAKEHPVGMGLGGIGVGVIGANLLDDD